MIHKSPRRAAATIALLTLATSACSHPKTLDLHMATQIDQLTQRPPDGVVVVEGRRVTYAQYGDPEGDVVFYFSGGDSSRLEGAALEGHARALRVRVIAPDRPGFGGSDPAPTRRLLDWPRDVAAIASQLKIRRFGVIALSGGAPHGLATAWAIPERITTLVLVGAAPAPPFAALATDIALPFRLVAKLADWSPWALRKLLEQQRSLAHVDPAKLLRQTRGGVGAADAAYLAVHGGAYVASKRLGYAQGVSGSVTEHLLYRRDWGFRVEEIRVQTKVFVGDNDVMASMAANRALAAAIPDASFHVVAGEGHLSLVPNQADRLLRAAAPSGPTDAPSSVSRLAPFSGR